MENIEVIAEKVKVLDVTVVRATKVTRNVKVHMPDPYVTLRNINSPNAKQKTTVKDNNVNPVWKETLTFYLSVEKENTLELVVKNKRIAVPDTVVGTGTVDLDNLPIDESVDKVVAINKKTRLYIKMLVRMSDRKDLRFSRELCDMEKEFVQKRKEEIFKNLQTILPKEKVPKKVKEVPVIAIMGSGGGYRAACGLSGTFCALQEAGILDCATYVAGLSGSSWYISTLYSHEGWPHNVSCKDVGKHLRNRFNTKLRSHFNHLEFRAALKSKRKHGQPVTMTDFIGMAIGDALLQNKLSKFSNQRLKTDTAKVPLPLCTAVRVEKAVSAEIFSEWMEFSPYEFGISNYGVFGNMADFGSKFYKGHLVTRYEEAPLHYMQGMWGSAFSILLNRVIGDEAATTSSKSSKEMAKEYFIESEMELIGKGDEDVDNYENEVEKDAIPKEKKPPMLKRFQNAVCKFKGSEHKAATENGAEPKQQSPEKSKTPQNTDNDSKEKTKLDKGKKKKKGKTDDSIVEDSALNGVNNGSEDQMKPKTKLEKGKRKDKNKKEASEKNQENVEDTDIGDSKDKKDTMKKLEKRKNKEKVNKGKEVQEKNHEEVEESDIGGAEDKTKTKQLGKDKNKKKGEQKEKESEAMAYNENEDDDMEDEQLLNDEVNEGHEDEIKKKFWVKDVLTPGKIFKTRQGRAAEVLNMFRGLKFKHEKDGKLHPCSSGTSKTMCLVDAGLAFNSPYPAVLRPERNVDLIFSFDFSQRDQGDNSMPFEELIKAEKWARSNHIPFPPIADNPVMSETDFGECYVFDNPDDPHCPTILHFSLINKTFKEYSAPGVARVTDDEKAFADFQIFDDPAQPYSSFTFEYDGPTFDRLHELMKYNTLQNLELIKEKIADHVKYRRKKRYAKPYRH